MDKWINSGWKDGYKTNGYEMEARWMDAWIQN